MGDRGMLTAARIREDLAALEGLRWVATLRAPTIRKLVNAFAVTASLFDQRDLAEITSDEFPDERLIVCRNPLLAAERQRKPHELLAATEKGPAASWPRPDATTNRYAARRTWASASGRGDQPLQDGEALRDRHHRRAPHVSPQRGDGRGRGTARRHLHRPIQRRAGAPSEWHSAYAQPGPKEHDYFLDERWGIPQVFETQGALVAPDGLPDSVTSLPGVFPKGQGAFGAQGGLPHGKRSWGEQHVGL